MALVNAELWILFLGDEEVVLTTASSPTQLLGRQKRQSAGKNSFSIERNMASGAGTVAGNGAELN